MGDERDAQGEATDFLYPMIDGAATDVGALLDDLAASASAKAADSALVTARAEQENREVLERAAVDVADRVRRGGRLLTCGNGGSATDAQSLAALFGSTSIGSAVPARSLVDDVSVLTALANDIGVDAIFSRQVRAHATEHDVLVASSTSGNSANLLEAARVARQLGLLCVGLAGGDGGRMRTSGWFDHLLVVDAPSIHRIQEAQARLGMLLHQAVGNQLASIEAGEVAG